MTQVEVSTTEAGVSKPKTRPSLRSLFKSTSRSKSLPPPYTSTTKSPPTPPELPRSSTTTTTSLSSQTLPLPTPTHPPYGLFPLHPLPLPLPTTPTHPIDIIALHGINGHCEKTWTHFASPADFKANKGGVFWLRDFLPGEFPGARIWTFGYDARLVMSRGTGDIETFAGALLEGILDVRGGREEQRRPIIFICHSMGGLVVKRALTKAHHTPRYTPILSHTTAILFLATPHRGSLDAAFLANIATLSNLSLSSTGVSRFKGRIRDDLIKGLRRDDEVVVGIARGFVPLMGRMRFYSFVEGEVTVPLGRRVVDDISSQMNVPNEVVIHMPGEDHRSIARFSSVTSPSYKKVLAKLREAVYAALSPVMKIIEEEDGPCLQTLTFPHHHNPPPTHPQTCTWILTHPTYLHWLNTPTPTPTPPSTPSILSLKGHPGTGKSTLLSTLHRHLTQTTPSAIHLSFFFTSRGVLLQRSVLGMYRALLWQVYRQSSRAREMVLEVYEEKVQSFGKEGWEWGVSELRGLVGRVVRRVSREREVIVLVDAVDEAVRGDGERAAGEVVEWFYTLDNTDLGSGSGDGDGDGDGSDVNGLRICISSRHYPIISLESRLEIRLEDENANDLHRYIHDSLRLGIQGWANEPEHITQPLLSIISSKAAGVFQWAVLRVPKIIKSLNDGEVTFEESQKMIEQESNELFPLYQKIITNDVSLSLRSRSLLFLQWVAFAERPLSLAELRFAIASDGQDRPFSQDCCEKEGGFIDSDARMAKLTKSLSGGLAEVVVCESVSRVQFIHQTVNEYLRSQGLEMLSSFSMDVGRGDVIGRSQQRLTTSCLNYLRIEYVVDAINAWIKWNEKIPVFIEYTAKYLFQHASHAEQHGNIQKDLATFFNTHPDLFPLWQKICWKLDTSRPYCATEHLIHIAAVFNISSIVQYFLERGVTLEVRDRDGHTPLALVAKRGDERMTRMFLDLGADVNTVNDDNCTPLELAAANSHETVVKQLLEKGAEIQGKGEMRTFRSALQGAVFGGRLSLVRVLIASGADINTRHEYYGTPLQEAAALETDDIAMLLIESGAEINTPCGRDGSALQAAAYRGHRSLIRVLLERGADVNAQGGEYGNALQAAAIYGIGHIDIIKLLLASGADINAVGGAYGTVLQAVLLPGNEALIQLLLDHGADVNIQAGEFGNAIMSAAMSGDEGIVRMLIEKGADIHAVAGEYGNTLQAAVLSGNGALVEFLLEIGVDVNVRCGKYGTALQAAVICKPELAETLLKWKADVNIPGTEYGNPLYAAVSLGRNDLISRILERGANVNMKVERHLSTLFSKVLQQAAKKGDTKVVKQLLAYGAEVNAVDETYGTALKIASTSGFKEVAEMLLDSGADVNLTGPLRAAAVGGHREVVELLINRGADSDPNDDISTIISKARGGQRKAPDHY